MDKNPQNWHTYKIAGTYYPRIKLSKQGLEQGIDMCYCGAVPGELHKLGCSYEVCPCKKCKAKKPATECPLEGYLDDDSNNSR